MKFTMASLLALVATAVTATPTLETRASKPKGIDVSHFQGVVDFAAAAANGISFAYIKATEGTSESSSSYFLASNHGEPLTANDRSLHRS